MAKNLSIDENNARFVDYPYDLQRVSSQDLHDTRLKALAARIHEGETVLDVGCNSGGLSFFVPTSCTVFGVDLAPALVAQARQQSRCKNVQVAPAERLPFADKQFDVTVWGAIIEYLYDPLLALHESVRVTKRAIVGTADHPDGTWGAHRVKDHPFMVRSYTEDELRTTLEQIGTITWFEVIGRGESPNWTPEWFIFEVSL